MLDHLVAFARETPWAVRPETLSVIREVLMRRASGERLSEAEIARLVAEGREARLAGDAPMAPKGVAVLPLMGIIAPRANLVMDVSQSGTGIDKFSQMFQAAMENPEVGAILIDTNSPGGSVYGVDELSREIYEARGRKPIVAAVNHQMASAAFYIGTAADEVWISPSAEIGSVGVYSMHADWSGAYEKAGVKVTEIVYGENKAALSQNHALSEEALAFEQSRVDDYGRAFEAAVARNRGVSADVVHSTYGQGRMYGAEQAVRLGMADHIGTIRDAANRAFELMEPGRRLAEVERERMRLEVLGN